LHENFFYISLMFELIYIPVYNSDANALLDYIKNCVNSKFEVLFISHFTRIKCLSYHLLVKTRTQTYSLIPKLIQILIIFSLRQL
jgi:phosphohistidine phosphatase SixA